jgi:hypothetical protein
MKAKILISFVGGLALSLALAFLLRSELAPEFLLLPLAYEHFFIGGLFGLEPGFSGSDCFFGKCAANYVYTTAANTVLLTALFYLFIGLKRKSFR